MGKINLDFAILNDTRTNVIEILESYGGKNIHNLVGDVNGFYFINKDNEIDIYHGGNEEFQNIYELKEFKPNKAIGVKINNSCVKLLSYDKCKVLYDNNIINIETSNIAWSEKDKGLLFLTNEDKDYIRKKHLTKEFVPALGISELIEIIQKHNICKHFQTCNVTLELNGPEMEVELTHDVPGKPPRSINSNNLYNDRGFGVQTESVFCEGNILNNLYYFVCKLYGIKVDNRSEACFRNFEVKNML